MSPHHVATNTTNHSPTESTPGPIEQQVANTAVATPDRPPRTAPQHDTINPTNHPPTESTPNQFEQQVTNAAARPSKTLAIDVEEERETIWKIAIRRPKQ